MEKLIFSPLASKPLWDFNSTFSKDSIFIISYKSFSKYALQTIDFESTKSNGYGFQVEMVYLAEKNKLSIKEVPIVFEERRLGKSKMSIKITLEAFLLLLKIYFKKQ